MRIVTVLLGALVLAGCAGSSEPVVFSGTLEDQLGQPVSGATVVLETLDNRQVPAGDEPPVVFTFGTTTDANGQFELRFPPEDLVGPAVPNGGLISFSATARLPGRNTVWTFNLVREIGLDGWADTATPIRWRPSP